MRQELETVLSVARTLPSAELPAFIGQLSEVQAVALQRLTAPAPIQVNADRDGQDVLSVKEAAAFIGFSPKWVYKNQDLLPRLPISSRLKFRRTDLSCWLDQYRVEPKKPR